MKDFPKELLEESIHFYTRKPYPGEKSGYQIFSAYAAERSYWQRNVCLKFNKK